MLCEYKHLTIGSGGGGPAIRLDAELYNGTSAECETFDSPMLILDGE